MRQPTEATGRRMDKLNGGGFHTVGQAVLELQIAKSNFLALVVIFPRIDVHCGIHRSALLNSGK